MDTIPTFNSDRLQLSLSDRKWPVLTIDQPSIPFRLHFTHKPKIPQSQGQDSNVDYFQTSPYVST